MAIRNPTNTKGKWYYGKRIKSSGAPPKRAKRKVFWEKPENRCAAHHAYRIGCSCVRGKTDVRGKTA